MESIMIKKLSKHGNSLVILIDKPILELLNLNEDTPLRISTDGNNIIIQPIRDAAEKPGSISSDTKIQAAYEKLAEKYAIALKELAAK
jgi:antitoxin component of MazEF toxin-antitoxin module